MGCCVVYGMWWVCADSGLGVDTKCTWLGASTRVLGSRWYGSGLSFKRPFKKEWTDRLLAGDSCWRQRQFGSVSSSSEGSKKTQVSAKLDSAPYGNYR